MTLKCYQWVSTINGFIQPKCSQGQCIYWSKCRRLLTEKQMVDECLEVENRNDDF